jgi:transcriptional regulator with XRE-family HTH domain
MKVRPNGAAIRDLRNEQHLSQENLAAMCDLHPRTIQRAEAGDSLSKEALAFIAAALRVSTGKLTVASDNAGKAEVHEDHAVVLRRTESARVIIEGLVRADKHVLEYDVDPTEETAESIIELIKQLEKFDPYQNPPVRMPFSDRIRATAAIHQQVVELAKKGVFTFYGEYIAMGLRPDYSVDEQCWYTKVGQQPESLQVSVVVVSDNPSETMSRRAPDKQVAPYVVAPYVDDDIPF